MKPPEELRGLRASDGADTAYWAAAERAAAAEQAAKQAERLAARTAWFARCRRLSRRSQDAWRELGGKVRVMLTECADRDAAEQLGCSEVPGWLIVRDDLGRAAEMTWQGAPIVVEWPDGTRDTVRLPKRHGVALALALIRGIQTSAAVFVIPTVGLVRLDRSSNSGTVVSGRFHGIRVVI